MVALVEPVDGWPTGTTGTVISDRSAIRLVEISNHIGEAVDYLDVLAEGLRLVCKSPHPPCEGAVD